MSSIVPAFISPTLTPGSCRGSGLAGAERVVPLVLLCTVIASTISLRSSRPPLLPRRHPLAALCSVCTFLLDVGPSLSALWSPPASRLALAGALRSHLVLHLLQRRRYLLLGAVKGRDQSIGVAHIGVRREEGVDVGVTVCTFEDPVQVQLECHGKVKVHQHRRRLAKVKVPTRGDFARHDEDRGLAQFEAFDALLPDLLWSAEVK
mmetsp:Transcript_23605/g.67502  ORF Transcript_23605/g.67502 Transcript_23605/m.67502 type:complete len:206 (-) Transcript_23605:1585-2202(-)